MMDQNPYQAPQSEGDPKNEKKRQLPIDLQTLANLRRALFLCIVVRVSSELIGFLTPLRFGSTIIIISLMMVLSALVSCFLTCSVLLTVRRVSVAIVLSTLAIVPCIGLIVVVCVYEYVTAILKSHGVQVGWLSW